MARSVTCSQPLTAMRARAAGADREHAVEQQHALVGPGGQVAVLRGLDTEVVAQLAVDVLEAARAAGERPRSTENDSPTGCPGVG